MKTVLSFLLLLAMLSLPASLRAQRVTPEEQKLASSVSDSVVLLYTQDETGGLHMTCTGTAYRKTLTGYRFVSAAHCVTGDTDDEQKQIRFFVTSDKKDLKSFIEVTLVEAGDKQVGDDFSIFEAKTDLVFPITPLGDSTAIKPGDSVLDVSSPLGLGKQLFVGYVSLSHVDRPKLDAGDVQWTDVMLVNIGSGPGSSGSAIVSEDQKAIVGFLVGGFPNAQIGAICIPVSKFEAFEKKVDEGKYVKTKPRPRGFLGIF